MRKYLVACLVMVLFSYASASTPLFSQADPLSFTDNGSNYLIENSITKVEIYKDATGYNKYYDPISNDVIVYDERFVLQEWKTQGGGQWQQKGTAQETSIRTNTSDEISIVRSYTDFLGTDYNVVYTLKPFNPLKMTFELFNGANASYRINWSLDGIDGANNIERDHGYKFGNSEEDYSFLIDWTDVWDSYGKDMNIAFSTSGNGKKGDIYFHIGTLGIGETFTLDPAIGSNLFATPVTFKPATVRTDFDTIFANIINSTNDLMITGSIDGGTTFTPIDVNLMADVGDWEHPSLIYDSTNTKLIALAAGSNDLNASECDVGSNSCLLTSHWSGGDLTIADNNLVGSSSYACDINSDGFLICVYGVGEAAAGTVRYSWIDASNTIDDGVTDWTTFDVAFYEVNLTGFNIVATDSNFHAVFKTGGSGDQIRYFNYSELDGLSPVLDLTGVDAGLDTPFGIDFSVDGNVYVAAKTDAGAAVSLAWCGSGIDCGDAAGNWDVNLSVTGESTVWDGSMNTDNDGNLFLFYPITNEVRMKQMLPTYEWKDSVTLHSNEGDKISASRNSTDFGYQDYLHGDSGTVWWDTFSASPTSTSGITASFVYTPSPLDPLDPENGTDFIGADFNGTSTFVGAIVLNSWQWQFDTNIYNPRGDERLDQNMDVDFVLSKDYNTCLLVGGNDGVQDFNDMKCEVIHVSQYPQAVDFSWIPVEPIVFENVEYGGVATDTGITNWNFGFPLDINISGVDANVIRQWGSSGVQQVCMVVDDNESLSRQACNNITVGGAFLLHFSDENTGAILVPTVTIDGNSYTVDPATGTLTVDLDTLGSGDRTVMAFDDNHATRYWTYNIGAATIDHNVVLLDTNRGRDVEFQFHFADGTFIPQAYVTLLINDVNRASIRKTDWEGKTTFFLNPQDQNYFFSILDANDTTHSYFLTETTVLIPLDESTLATITPFDIVISNVHNYSSIFGSVDFTVPLFPDTVPYHIFDINADDYHSRRYSERFDGGVESFVLQPYLVPITGGVRPIIHVFNYHSKETIPDVLIISKKTINGVDVTVETVVTDDTGRGQFSFIQGDTYNLEFWLDGVLEYSATLVPDDTVDYYVYLDLQTFSKTSLSYSPITVVFYDGTFRVGFEGLTDPNRTISRWQAKEDVTGMTHFEQDVTTQPDQNVITSIRVEIIYDINTIVFDETFSGTGIEDGNLFVQDINTYLYEKWRFFSVKVTTVTTFGTFYHDTKYHVLTSGRYNVMGGIEGFVGEFGIVGTTLIALFITAFAIGSLAFFGIGGEISNFFVGAGLLGLFVVFGWIQWEIWVLALAMGAATVYLIRKW